jgi:hypothetical protein
MGRACRKHGESKNAYHWIFVGKLAGKRRLEHLYLVGHIILKWILKKYFISMWMG